MSSTNTPDPSVSSAATMATVKPMSPSSVTSTPSPSSSANTAPNSARRPPRKSTLTQQQKNNKRQRATQDQLVTLELEFNKNPTPTAATRERIAQEINMTERSVQIWFQNRRAKIKMLAKKSIETGEGCDSIPESMRQYLAMQFDPSRPGARDPFGRTGGGYGPNSVYPNEPSNSGKVVIHHFTCRSLTVGSWRRIGQNAMDLVVFYSPEKACMTYYINNDSAGYKIEYPFSHIKNITLESGDQPQPNGCPPRPAGLVVELNHPPLFYMDSSNSGGFYQCSDFTEDQQASQIMVHHLGGHPKVLSVQLAKLVSLESFQNRMAYNNFAMHGPMSPPFIQRPASQPNHFAHPFVGMYQENHLNVNVHAARGHKRQRSRSVPVAVDFNSMQTPLNSYGMPQPHPHPHPHQHPQQAPPFSNAESGIYSPVPQSTHPLAANLRVDTAAGYGMDVRGPPMSAATTASPPEFASPSLFAHGHGEATPIATNVGSQFNLPYVSTTIEPSNPTTQAPYPNIGPADPLIADHSPPLPSMHTSSDGYGIGSEQQSTFHDDGMGWGEILPKQSANFAVPNAMGYEGNNFDVPMHGMSAHTSPGLQGEFQSMTHPGNGDQHTLASGS